MTTLQPSGAPTMLDAVPGDEVPKATPWVEFGITGLRRNSGYIDEEFLPQLRGRKAVKVYREMADNSPIIGGWVNAVSELLRQIEWRVEPPNQSSEGRKAAEFVEQCMDDMEHSWGDMITEVLSFIIYGWELSEMMFKYRKGPWTKGRDHSKYDDGKVGWASISGRSQETILRWIFAENGAILGAVQQAPPRYEKRILPMGKCLLFRTSVAKNNPEGRSMIRNCYEPWYYLKRHQEIEAVGVARDLAGMPIAKVPSKILEAKTPADMAMREAIRKLVTSVSRNENEGIIWPQEFDGEKNPTYDFELLTSGGSRQFDTESIINRYKTEMLQAVLADFLQVGHEANGGAYNMHADKTGLFRTSINALAQRIADVFNRQAIPLLFEINQWKLPELPTIAPNNVDPPDLTVLGSFLTQTGQLGVQWFPDPVMEQFVRDAAGLPQLDKRTEDALEAQRRQAGMMAMAQQRFGALQLDQQVRQGEMGIQQQAQQLTAGPEQGDPNDAKRSNIGVQTDKVKLAQEKQKLSNLKKPPGGGPQPSRPAGRKAPAGKKQPVKKIYIAKRVKESA